MTCASIAGFLTPFGMTVLLDPGEDCDEVFDAIEPALFCSRPQDFDELLRRVGVEKTVTHDVVF